MRSGTVDKSKEMSDISNFVANHSASDLFIYDLPVHLLIQPRDCVNFKYFKENIPYFLDQMKKGRWQNIWALQYWNTQKNEIVPEHILPSQLRQSETERFNHFSALGFEMRIQKLTPL